MLEFLNIKAWLLALTVVAGRLAGRADIWPRFALGDIPRTAGRA